MKRKITSVQIKAFALLMIFFINTIALCSCGFAQTHSHHKMMMKDCSCCKHHHCDKDNTCKTNHALSFSQQNKTPANAISVQVSAVHCFLVSHFILLPENNFSSILVVYHRQISIVDTSPPDLNILFRSFLI
ncbi:hypothetical protein A9P82_12855 [Arachidicoccus ginsenosidimutans]|uniref:hypothetical protein n=1 Tax=Arachidicoccus sp. BS20 TaxID=1850526 RepID=UPI0007F0F882|nr:hypothetical protein [Arachidicoccus sp. BS20]ANI90093.1 hypothetical protein A9P82_12855 [Arachidicoccus sp. BS20]